MTNTAKPPGPASVLLIHAAAGGWASPRLDSPSARGCPTWLGTTASAAQHERARAFGVDEPLDYNPPPDGLENVPSLAPVDRVDH